ncbi:hypothetical protein [Halobacillus campisalis]|uniref:Uncharacterized protein n=1 Tax=Halobacillus campisalis TaxID=435909 RepID=A0ABW2K577_9BACI|nr:hypothetical protein [Halobacillus campisalis]
MKGLDRKRYEKSLHLLTGFHLAKKSMEAYHHAKETVGSGSPIADEITSACAAICRDCVENIKQLNDEELQEVMKICLANAMMCDELYSNVK